ncbi:hypothetical protein VTO42DRAFT_6902 [Malbranchea cinnamomea]
MRTGQHWDGMLRERSGPVITLIGSDSEMKDASRQLPKAMLMSAGINCLIGFLMLLAVLFVVGDVGQVLATPTGQPWVQVLWNATQSKHADDRLHRVPHVRLDQRKHHVVTPDLRLCARTAAVSPSPSSTSRPSPSPALRPRTSCASSPNCTRATSARRPTGT